MTDSTPTQQNSASSDDALVSSGGVEKSGASAGDNHLAGDAARASGSTVDMASWGGGPSSASNGHERGKVIFGDYEIIREISRGSMGVVYQARQISLNRIVALKILQSGEYASERLVTRFRREAKSLAGLSHPAIVPLYECGEERGTHFFTMAYIDGVTLGDRVRRDNLSVRESLEITAVLADALSQAHERGVIHRDVKPSNIMIDSSGNVRLMDFGLAKHTVDETGHTRSGTMIGTPSYMSPEQARGESRHVDVRTDVYSLGAVLYEMLVGHAPFTGDSVLEIVLKVINEDPVPPKKINSAIHADVQTIVMKCLDKHPAERYANMLALRDDLRRFLNGESIQAKPPSVSVRAMRWILKRAQAIAIIFLMAALVVTIGAFLTYQYFTENRPVDSPRPPPIQSQRPTWKELYSVENPRRLFTVGSDVWLARPIRVPAPGAAGKREWVSCRPTVFFGNGEFSVRFDADAGLDGLDITIGLVAWQDNDVYQIPWLATLRGGRLMLVGPANNDMGKKVSIRVLREAPAPVEWMRERGEYELMIRRDGMTISVKLSKTDAPHRARVLSHASVTVTNWVFKYERACFRTVSGWRKSGVRVTGVTLKNQTDPEHPTRLLPAARALFYGEYDGAIQQLSVITQDTAAMNRQDPLTARFLLGMAYEGNGNWNRAKDQYLFLQTTVRNLIGGGEVPLLLDESALTAAPPSLPKPMFVSLVDDMPEEKRASARAMIRMYAEAAARRFIVFSWQEGVSGERDARQALAECYHAGGPGRFTYDVAVAGLEWTTKRNRPFLTEEVWWSLTESERNDTPVAGTLPLVVARRDADNGDVAGVVRISDGRLTDTFQPEYFQAIRVMIRALGKKLTPADITRVCQYVDTQPAVRMETEKVILAELLRSRLIALAARFIDERNGDPVYRDDDLKKIAHELIVNRNWDAAELVYSRALAQFRSGVTGAQDPSSIKTELVAGLMAAGRFVRAMDVLMRTPDGSDDDLIARALSNLSETQPEKASEYLSRLTGDRRSVIRARFPDTAPMLSFRLAAFKWKHGDSAAARAILRKMASDKSETRAYQYAAKLLIGDVSISQVEGLQPAMKQTFGEAGWLFVVGWSHAMNGDMVGAKKAFDSARARLPEKNAPWPAAVLPNAALEKKE